ncbi:hypothetical protein [Flagellimonas onchidii]|nr:hypothetical protein [Allomuricauda onchidii]
MDKKKLGQKRPLTEGVVKNNQVKPNTNINKEAVLKPPAAKPKK